MTTSSLADFELSVAVRHPYVVTILAIIGLYKVSTLLKSYISVIKSSCIPRKSKITEYKVRGQADVWAVVTGPTAGIGEEFAYQIAKRKFNIALIGRNQAKLEIIADEIEKKYDVKTAIYRLDAAAAKREDYDGLAKFVNDLGTVTVLINNLGVSHDIPTPFTEVSHQELNEIIQVNCVATLEITQAVIPAIKKSISTGPYKGLIMTMGSFAGLVPTPLISVYSGSKSFLQSWSSALAEELKADNIDVQLIISYLVTSKMSKVRRTSMTVPNPKGFVNSVLRQIGMNGGAQERAYTMTPYWSHALMHWWIISALGAFSGLVSKFNLKMHKDIRKRALRKRQREE